MASEEISLRERALRMAQHTPREAQVYATLYLADQQAEANAFEKEKWERS